MNCDVGKATEELENELWHRWSDGNVGECCISGTLIWPGSLLWHGDQGCSFIMDCISAVASRCFPHPTFFSIWTDLKRSEKIPEAPTCRWGEWIWLTGPSGLHRNSPGLNMSSPHSPTFPSLHLRHNSFSNPSIALPTSQLILQPFRCFTFVTVHSPTLLSLLLRHKLFT